MGLKRTAMVGLMWASMAWSHCAICYRTAQGLGAARGRVLNAGILVLATPPVLMLAGFAVLVARRKD
jgi:hypothetical protein